MGRRVKRPGWLVSVNLGGRFVAVSGMALNSLFSYLMALALWMLVMSSHLGELPGSWLAFLIVAALGIPLAISVAIVLVEARIALSQGRAVAGFLFSGTTLVPDVRVSPSRPLDYPGARPYLRVRCALLAIVAVVAVVTMNAQLLLSGPGPFRAFWIGTVAAGWSLIVLPAALFELLEAHVYPAPTPRVRTRRLRIVALAFLCLLAAWTLVLVHQETESSFRYMVQMFLELPIVLGLVMATMISGSVVFAQRAIARDLRHVAVEAVAVDGAVPAVDALAGHDSPGFLVTDPSGQLVGWLSRDDALGSPGSLMRDLARPLTDPVPIEAEQRLRDLSMALDSHVVGREVVALAHEGTPVGYIVVARAFEYVTGDSGWTRILDAD